MRAEPFDTIEALPDDARRLLGAAGFFSTEAWLRLVCAHALPDGARPEFLVCRQDGGSVALLPMAVVAGRLGSLTTPYTSRYAPMGRYGMSRKDWSVAGEAAGLRMRAVSSVRLDAIDVDDPCLAGFTDGLRRAGLVVMSFEHFGNWHEPVAGRGWDAYLASRPGQLRETLRRKARKASGLQFEMISGGARLDAGVEAYASVYARSWKEPEPFPGFPGALIRAAAAAGVLRLGLCWKADEPAAAQIWIVHDRQASVHKLAHDDAAKSDSPGTLLTAFVLQPLLDGTGVDEIDFGRGDDAYKQSWAGRRRQRIGLTVINPRRPAGAALLALEGLGAARRGLRTAASLSLRSASAQVDRGASEHDPKTR